MIKCSPNTILKPITKLFNKIFSCGKLPSSWKISYLTPIHKKGDKNYPSNYRGIAISSNLYKLFLFLNSRLECFALENDMLPNNQIGFKKKCRTSDHILTLKAIIDKYISLFAIVLCIMVSIHPVWVIPIYL